MENLHKEIKRKLLETLMSEMDKEDGPRMISISVQKKEPLVAQNDAFKSAEDKLKELAEQKKKEEEEKKKKEMKLLEQSDMADPLFKRLKG